MGGEGGITQEKEEELLHFYDQRRRPSQFEGVQYNGGCDLLDSWVRTSGFEESKGSA